MNMNEEIPIKINKESKIFFLVSFLVLFGSLGFGAWKFFIAKDYYIKFQADCDPEIEACFAYECTPDQDPECPEEEAERVSYYKNITQKAYLIPLCNPNGKNCSVLACNEGEDCEETLCSEETIEEGTQCNDPAVYLEEQAATAAEEEAEEEETCALEDTECLESEDVEESEETESEEETEEPEESESADVSQKEK